MKSNIFVLIENSINKVDRNISKLFLLVFFNVKFFFFKLGIFTEKGEEGKSVLFKK